MKDKAFARAVSRDDLRAGAELLGLPLDEHISNVIGFMRERPTRSACGEPSDGDARGPTCCDIAFARTVSI